MSGLLTGAAESCADDSTVMPLHSEDIPATAFRQALSFCEGSINHAPNSAARHAWQRQFLVNFETLELVAVILAADYMLITELTITATAVLHDRIHGKDVAGLRSVFGLRNDLTPERQRSLVADYGWGDDPAF